MAYGEKRGFRAPGEFKTADMFGLILASAAGIIAALVTDFQQQGEASAHFTINQWAVALGGMLGFTDIPLWMVVVGLTALGAGSVFYFQPVTRQGAFAQGFGLLAVLVTVAPGDFAGGIESIDGSLAGAETTSVREASLTPRFITASFSPARMLWPQAEITPVHNVQSASKYDLHLVVNFTEGIPEDIETMIRRGTIRGRLHNEETKETWNLFRSAGGTIRLQGDKLLIDAGVPASGDTARLWVRIECAGYAIEEQSAIATIGQSLEWTVDLNASTVPLMVQRLGKSYWY